MTLGSIALVLLIAAPAVAPDADEPADAGLRQARGYMNLSPLGFGLVPGYTSYVWGVDAGYHIPIKRRFAVQVGAFFDHHVLSGSGHYLGFGPQLRVGGGSGAVYGYGLVSVAATLGVEAIHGGRDTYWFARPTLGGGVLGRVHRHVTLGVEPTLDLFVDRGYFGTIVAPYFRLRAFVGFLF